MRDLTTANLAERMRQWRLASDREREERSAQRLTPQQSLDASLELIALANATHADDPIRERGVTTAREHWAALRRALG